MMVKLFIIIMLLCCFGISNSRIINMYTTNNKDSFGNTYTTTSFGIPNKLPSRIDGLLGSATDQAISYNQQSIFSVKPNGGDIIHNMQNNKEWFKTNMGGQIIERCVCAGQGLECSCHTV